MTDYAKCTTLDTDHLLPLLLRRPPLLTASVTSSVAADSSIGLLPRARGARGPHSKGVGQISSIIHMVVGAAAAAAATELLQPLLRRPPTPPTGGGGEVVASKANAVNALS